MINSDRPHDGKVQSHLEWPYDFACPFWLSLGPSTGHSLAYFITIHLSSPTKLPLGRLSMSHIISKYIPCHFNTCLSLIQLDFGKI